MGFKVLFNYSPYPLQQAICDLPNDDDSLRLLIAESETGSGKTEAALARFFNLFSTGKVDSLYFALPTRVAARQLYERIYSYIKKIFPQENKRPPVLLAVPGYARLDDTPVEQLLPEERTRWQDDARRQFEERMWAAERPKRFLAATIAVGTIDQALLSSLQVTHAHLRSICLDRSLLVVDEVHASDPYMRKLLKGLLQHHLGIGGHALLLSATLGARMRSELTDSQLPKYSECIRSAYPSLTDRRGKIKPIFTGTKSNKVKHVSIEIRQGMWKWEALVSEVTAAIKAGARILILLNTVNRAIACQRDLEQCDLISDDTWFRCKGIICPHHGRFAPADRVVLDKAVTSTLGENSPPGPLLIIATQTLEQSLDVDVDLLITDLCPLDVLLQRIGRLHRHDRIRPSRYKEARCLILSPQTNDLSTFLDKNGKAVQEIKKSGIGSVYEDVRVIQRTLDVLSERPRLEIPRNNRELVESATHPESLAGLRGEKWQRHTQKIDGAGLAKEVQAHYALLTELYDKGFNDIVFNGPGDEARTRLGLNTICPQLGRSVISPFKETLSEITIPGYLVNMDAIEERAEVVSENTDHFTFSFGKRKYIYSRFGLEALNESAP